MSSMEDYKRAYETQREARRLAETLLEQRSFELYQKNQSLKAAMDQLTAKQQELIAQEKLASIGQLSAGLAHEINNPNAFVQSNIDTLKSYIDTLKSYITNLLQAFHSLETLQQPPTKEAISDIRKQYDIDYIMEDVDALLKETYYGTQRIENIIKGLKYFTQPNRQHNVHFDINSCIAHTAGLIRSEVGDELEIQEHYEDIPQIDGMPQLFSQAISSVLKNAAESQSDSKSISVSTHFQDNQIRIEIKDEGIGIPVESLQKVFDPFYTTKQSANGMGLPIAQAIIQQHDGSIQLTSSEDAGTTVTILLPAAH